MLGWFPPNLRGLGLPHSPVSHCLYPPHFCWPAPACSPFQGLIWVHRKPGNPYHNSLNSENQGVWEVKGNELKFSTLYVSSPCQCGCLPTLCWHWERSADPALEAAFHQGVRHKSVLLTDITKSHELPVASTEAMPH